MKNIIFGTRQIGGSPSYNNINDVEASNVLEHAYKKGFKTFDTAPIYGNGKSEKLLGDFIMKNNIRKEVKIITKFGIRFDEKGNNHFNFSKKSIIEEVEQSLLRLKTDYIDIYLLHIPDGSVNPGELVSILNNLKSKGKILSYGLCNSYEIFLNNLLNYPGNQFEYIEDFYNIIEKKAEKLIFPFLDNNKHKFLSYSPFYRGVLFENQTINELIKKDENAINRLIKNNGLTNIIKKRKILEIIAEKKGIKLEKLAIDFLQNSKNIDSIIFGTKDKQHLDYFLSLIDN